MLNQILLALGFMTRLPVPHQLNYSADAMHRALVFFPLAGWVLAALLSLVWLVADGLFGSQVAVVVLVAASLLMTGALHEDGLADCFDGFYGGFETARKLEIMKDSRLGTYGTCALVLALLFKVVLLLQLAEQGLLILALIVAYPLSRALAITHAQDLEYVSAPGKSKSDPLAKPLSDAQLSGLLALGCSGVLVAALILCIATGDWRGAVWVSALVAVFVLLACAVARGLLRHWMNKHIQGFTGDALGAAQQFQELLIYLVLLACSQATWLRTELTGGWA
ncbi:adenosylcobinamide-GDP ribazoletransferase [Oceanobacter kriegii]|uniref:adenosylcobinamide-GDP ribazoletransferase n=1 Tax=Oceanobacter kriegii TaxID=64972 RepID=UPI000420A5B5|nr:adenosylcobinamide-GDP ribazoletransferase [Oceanobacter kriegii]